MRRAITSILIPAIAMTGLLGSLVAAAPAYNAAEAAPRSVFLQLPDTLPEPRVDMQARRLPSGGWRITLDASDFRFTEICVTDAEAMPVGHAHIVAGGVKLAAAYQPVVDIAPLPVGTHRVSVVLRGQDHRALLGRDGLITAEVEITVPAGGDAF